MNIRIDGTNTLNKGAELMLYAILEEVERKSPQATIYFNSFRSNTSFISTPLDFKKPPYLKYARYINGLLKRINKQYTFFPEFHAQKRIDWLMDASGFRHGDHWNHSPTYLDALDQYYHRLKKQGTKIILLPQAFGPFQTSSGKRSVDILNSHCDHVFAREEVSYKYLTEAGFDKEKISICSDFSVSVKGIAPHKYKDLEGGICVIPNERMVSHTEMTRKDYISLNGILIEHLRKIKSKVFLLNHEGENDLKLCKDINAVLGEKVPVVSGLNAKEIKGVIGNSSLVVSARFHGVASAINQGVPCFATSWSHKYELLFKDFGLEDHIIQLSSSPSNNITKIQDYLNDEQAMRLQLQKAEGIKKEVETMWEKVWQLAEI